MDVRWVASSFRAVKAVWNNYAALFAHFLCASIHRQQFGQQGQGLV